MKIRDMRKALDSKEISAKELAQTYFERIKKYDDKVKSFITVTEEKALEQAEKAAFRAAAGQIICHLSER